MVRIIIYFKFWWKMVLQELRHFLYFFWDAYCEDIYVTRYYLGKRARLDPLGKGQSVQMFFIWCHWRAQWFAFCDFVTFSIGGVWPLEALEESSSFSSTISVIRPPVPASFSWVTFLLGPTTVHKILFTSRIMFVEKKDPKVANFFLILRP